jgi:Phosphotransferase enzyme family
VHNRIIVLIPLYISRALQTHFGEPITRIFPAQHGFTAAIRCVVELSNGKRIFLKCATDLETQTWLRTERTMYSHFEEMSATFAPQRLLWINGDGAQAFDAMVLEDVGACEAAPPWSATQIESVLTTLESVHGLPPPNGLPRLAEAKPFTHAWKEIAASPDAALRQYVIDPSWWAQHGETLAALDGAGIFSGDALLHFDVRSDNMRFRNGQCLLFDWNWACVGNPRADCAAWLASLVMEGGALPTDAVRAHREEILLFMGFLLHSATQPMIPKAPALREFQRKQALALKPIVDALLR